MWKFNPFTGKPDYGGYSTSSNSITYTDDYVYLYVNVNTGDDANAGTALAPFETIQHALDVASRYVTPKGIVIYIADGLYQEGGSINCPTVLAGSVELIGNATNPENVVIDAQGSGTSGTAFNVINVPANIYFKGLRFINGQYGVYVSNGNVQFGYNQFFNNKFAVWGNEQADINFSPDLDGVSTIDGNQITGSYGVYGSSFSYLRIGQAMVVSGVRAGFFAYANTPMFFTAVPVITLLNSPKTNLGGIIYRSNCNGYLFGANITAPYLGTATYGIQALDSSIDVLAGSTFAITNFTKGIELYKNSTWAEGGTCTFTYTNCTTNAFVHNPVVLESNNGLGTKIVWFKDYTSSLKSDIGYDHRYLIYSLLMGD